MKQLSFVAFYIPRNTIWHRLPLLLKFILLLFYTAIIFASSTPLQLLSLCILQIMTTRLSRLPLRNRVLVFIIILLLAWTAIAPSMATAVARIIIAFGKVVCLMMLVALFSMTTKPSALLQLLRPSGVIGATLQPVIYIITTTLAILPSIQYDLQHAIDAETIRRGRKVQLYSLISWTTILTVVLVRVLTRAERLANSVIDRGYQPQKGLQPLTAQAWSWQDGGLFFLSLLAGSLVLILR